jgi:G3E family GTPase
MSPIPLYFIAGFLGSGKTSVLNSLLGTLGGRRAGLIINEFGSIGIDAGRLDGRGDDLFELNNGQIFCACLAGPLSSALVRLAEKRPDLILAECSGLSKPATLADMVEGVSRTTGGSIRFAGLLAVVDGPRYPILEQSVLAVREQLAYAKAVIINKTDLMAEGEIETLEASLLRVHPGLPILRTEFGRIGFSEIERLLEGSQEPPKTDADYTGWGEAGRPKSYTIHPAEALDAEQLSEFLNATAAETYRIKGTVPARPGGYFSVDCVGETVLFEHHEEPPAVKGLVIIVPGSGRGESFFRALWPAG